MLAFDIGNTQTKVVRFEDAAICQRKALATPTMTIEDIAEATQALQPITASEITATPGPKVLVASVVPEATIRVLRALEECGVSHPRVVDPSSDEIMEHDLPSVAGVGVDRLLAARAAFALCDESTNGLIVLQCGSALTVDYVDAGGVFAGGMILPGPRLWLSGLSCAAQLPVASADRLAVGGAPSATGKETEDAIRAGLHYGLAGAVRNAVMTIRKEHASDARLVLTGGWADFAHTCLGHETEVISDLVLHGLRLWSQSGATQ